MRSIEATMLGNTSRSLLLPLFVGALGCSASAPSPLGDDGAAAGPPAAGVGGAGAGGFDAGTGGPANAGAGGGQTCASATVAAEPVDTVMFISFDKSGSMDGDDKWPDATSALTSFFQDPGTDGLNVAMRFFGDDLPVGEGCSQYVCNLAACAVPHVPVGMLQAAPGDPHETALLQAIAARQPGGGGGTPIHPALHGATTWAASYRSQHPEDVVVVLLVTDGAPQGCIESVGAIAGVASDAYGAHGIRTYAVGLDGSSESAMNAIASAGGTGEAIFIGQGDVTAELLDALQQIQGEASLPCQYAMPTGEGVDPTKVNVTYHPGAGGEQTLGQVADASACGATAGGWYYDDPTLPTSIVFCPDTCDAVQGDPAGEVDIVLGCETVSATPR